MVKFLGGTRRFLSKLCLLVVLMRIYCLVGLPSSRSGPFIVRCMGCSVVCGLFRSTCLVCRKVRPVLAILRIGVVVCPGQTLIWLVGVLFGPF